MDKQKQDLLNDLKSAVEDAKDFYNLGLSNSIWSEVAKAMNEKYPKSNFTKESARSMHRYYFGNRKAKVIKDEDAKRGRTTLEERLLNKVKRVTALNYLSDKLGATEKDIMAAIANLQSEGYSNLKIWREGDKKFVHLVKRAREIPEGALDLTEKFKNSKTITIGVVSDMHLGSEYADEESLDHFYDECERRGISIVLNAGDLTEGYKSQRAETFLGNKAIGFQNQLEYAVKVYPKREGIKTFIISGNHDEFYLQNGSADIVKTFASYRDDIIFLGNSFGRINLTNKVDVTLYHPNDGSSRNVFSKAQNFIDRGMDKVSKINIIGHYHKVGWIKHRDVYALYPASFQKQSNWMNINNLKSYVGAFIITIKVDDEGNLLSFNPEYIDYDENH